MNANICCVLVSVVQRLDGAIHRINLYPLDSAISFPNIYPLDSDFSVDNAIQRLNNRTRLLQWCGNQRKERTRW